MSIKQVEHIVRDKIDAFEDECDLWKSNHEWAMLYFDFRDLIADGIRLFNDLCRLDENWREALLKQEIAYEKSFEDKIRFSVHRFYRNTKTLCEELLPSFEASFGDVEHADKIRSVYEELQGMVTPDDEFFADEKLLRLRDQAIADDEQGATIECDIHAPCGKAPL